MHGGEFSLDSGLLLCIILASHKKSFAGASCLHGSRLIYVRFCYSNYIHIVQSTIQKSPTVSANIGMVRRTE